MRKLVPVIAMLLALPVATATAKLPSKCDAIVQQYTHVAMDRDRGVPIWNALVKARDSIMYYQLAPENASILVDSIAFAYGNPDVPMTEIAERAAKKCAESGIDVTRQSFLGSSV